MSVVIVDSAVYRKGERIVDDLPPGELGMIRKLACEPGDFVWVGLHEPSEAEIATVEENEGENLSTARTERPLRVTTSGMA